MVTQEEKHNWIEQHIELYGMSEEEAAALVNSMTEAEVAMARQYGFGAAQKKDSLADIMARVRANKTEVTSAASTPALDVKAKFYDVVKKLCAARSRAFIEAPEFMTNCDAVLAWLVSGRKNADKWLLLCGTVGNGKTTAARAALITLRAMGEDGTEKNAYDIALLYREVNRNQRAADEYDRLCRCPFLFIDDLGTEGNAAALNELLYERYNQMRATIFTTNLSSAELSAKYGPRIFDRFAELAIVLRFTGGSFRARNRQMELAL